MAKWAYPPTSRFQSMPGSGDRNVLAPFQSVTADIYAYQRVETANRNLKSAGHSASRGTIRWRSARWHHPFRGTDVDGRHILIIAGQRSP